MAKDAPSPYLCDSRNGDESLFRGHITSAECADDIHVGADIVVEHIYARALPPPDGYSTWYVWPVQRKPGAFPATVARRVSTSGEKRHAR
jgi:hypothetical protein